ncbi:MAG: response regulator [Sedimenticola sp.]
MKSTESEIMVVDDTFESLILLTNILISEGYKVRPADTPQLAIKSSITTPPDLILLDINMPEMDGFEVCQRLKQEEKTKDIPIIFVSAFNALSDRVNGFEVGAVDYISKPVQREEVLARVKVHLDLTWKNRMLAEQAEELKIMNDSMAGRELRLLELKKEVNDLSIELGRSVPYDEAED